MHADGGQELQRRDAAGRLDGRAQALRAALEVGLAALALLVDGRGQHEVRPGRDGVRERRRRQHALRVRDGHLPALGLGPVGDGVDVDEDEPAHGSGLAGREDLVAAAGDAGLAGAELVAPARAGRGRRAPSFWSSRRAHASASTWARSTGSVTSRTGARAAASASPSAARSPDFSRSAASEAAVAARLRGDEGAGVALQLRAARADDRQVRAVAPRLADAQLEPAGALRHLRVARPRARGRPRRGRRCAAW